MTAPGPDTPVTPPQAASGTTAAGTGRPEPVLNAAAVAAGLTSLVGLVLTVLVLTHVLTPAGQAVLGPALAAAVPTAVGAVATLLAAWRARGHTLPLADPRVAEAWAAILAAEQNVQAALGQVRRPPGPQTPGVADHAAPDLPTGG